MLDGLGDKLRARVTAGLERAKPLRERLRRRRLLRTGSGDADDSPQGSPGQRRPTDRDRTGDESAPSEDEDSRSDGQSTEDSDGEAASQGLYRLRVHLRHGRHLPAMDSGGTSDPYIKFKLAGKLVHRSTIVYKTLHPVWDERFHVFLQDPYQNLHVKAYDYDWGINDDFLGQAVVDLCALEMDSELALDVPLCDTDDVENGGVVTLRLKLEPLTEEQIDELCLSQPEVGHQQQASRARDTGHWSHVLHVLLVSARGLLNMDAGDTSDPYCKFRLEREKYKSRVVPHTLSPEWLEAFELYMFENQSPTAETLEIELFDHDARTADDFLGRCSLDLSTLEKEKTHDLDLPLLDGTGSLRLLVTVTGATQPEPESDLLAHSGTKSPTGVSMDNQDFGWRCLLRPRQPLGRLTARVYKARGLAAADIGGRSDPYCVLQLVNQRRHTQTAYKTLQPHWNKIFTFDVNDIHTVLMVTVWDQDRDHQKEFLGRVHIPLLEIRTGERHWYSLKSAQLGERAKGSDPQILLQLDLACNPIKAALRSFLAREKRLKRTRPCFKTSILTNNIERFKSCIKGIVEACKLSGPILRWESPSRTVTAYVMFLLTVFFFELYMIPALLLFAFVRGAMTHLVTPGVDVESLLEDGDDEEEEQDTIEKDDKKTLREKLAVVQDIATTVQSVLGDIDSVAESAENLCGFAVPFVSWLAIGVLLLSTVLLYHVSVRLIIAVLGTRAFLKQLLWPGSAYTNDITNFLSCVPDHHQRHQRSELPSVAQSSGSAGRRQRQRDRYRQLLQEQAGHG